jgi:hypothetical protein
MSAPIIGRLLIWPTAALLSACFCCFILSSFLKREFDMRLFFAAFLALGFAGCAGEDRASMLGIARNTPDEFAILKRDPLAVPGDVRDPETIPSPKSLTSAAPSSQSRGASVVTGTPVTTETSARSVAITGGNAQAFADKVTSTTAVDPMIRQRLETDETESHELLNNPLNLVTSNKIIAPKGEYARLKALKEAKKPLSDGDPVAYQEQNPLLNGILP